MEPKIFSFRGSLASETSWPNGLVGWWIGELVDWWTGGLVDGWIGVMVGGLAEWTLAAWGLEGLQVNPSTRDRDGSADC